jgi:OOP family OmpA-OmpF porin
VRAAGALAICLCCAGAGAAQADCRVLDGDIRKAVSAGEVDRFADLHGAMLADATCDGAYRKTVGRVMALASLKQLQVGPRAEGAAAPIADLRRAAAYGDPWQLMAALGDAHYAAQEWSEAVRAYEAALDDLRDKAANPAPPARALAPFYVATPRFRGRPGGLASPEFRSFTADAVPVPVRFAHDKAELEEDGEAAARDILDYLKDRKPARVRLTGHTDPVGSDEYDHRLSLARAEAVAAYLAANGYEGAVEVVGKGKSEPFQADDPASYSDEQRHAFDRRVEYELLPH